MFINLHLFFSYVLSFSKARDVFPFELHNNELNHLRHFEIYLYIVDQTLQGGYRLASLMSKSYAIDVVKTSLMFYRYLSCSRECQ